MQIIRHPGTNSDEVFIGCLACGSTSLIASRTHFSLYNATACSEHCREATVSALHELTGLLEWLKAPAASVRVRQGRLELDVADETFSAVFRLIERVSPGMSPLSAWRNLDRRIRRQCRSRALSALKELWQSRKSANRLSRRDVLYIRDRIQEIKTNANKGTFPNGSVLAAASVYFDLRQGELQSAVVDGAVCSDFQPSSLTPVSIDVNERTIGILSALGIDGNVENWTPDEVRRMARGEVARCHPDRGGDRKQFEKSAALMKQLNDALAGPRFRSNSRHCAGSVQGLPGAFCYAPDSGPWFNPLPPSLLSHD